MKRLFYYASAFAMAMAMTAGLTSCSDDNGDGSTDESALGEKEQMMKILGGGSAYCHCYGLGAAIEVTQCSECESRCSNWGGVQNCNTIGG